MGGPANVRLGADLAWSNILSAIHAALDAAGLPYATLSQVIAGFGLAGVLKPTDALSMTGYRSIFRALHVSSDGHIACLGAYGGKDGAIQIVGTGSSGYAIVDGVGRTFGGWGFSLCEKASGAALGRDAVKRALDVSDGLRAGSAFTAAVLSQFGGVIEIVDWSDTARPRDYAALAPLAFHFAELGDAVACELVNQLASDCGRYIRNLVRAGAPRVSLLGGLAPQLLPWLQADITAHIANPEGDSLDGAILLARTGHPAQHLLRTEAQ